jgi:lysyl-tRNA synthetase class II
MVEEIIKEIVFSIDYAPHDHQGVFRFGNHLVDFNQPFRIVSFKELFQRGVHRDILQETDFINANKLFEKFCEPLIDPNVPTFVYGYPSAISPLTKTIAGAEVLSQRADLFIAGMEIGTIYTEQNDPQVQFDVFSQQLSDDEEATHRTMDHDFIEALKVGMPPTGGLGQCRCKFFICNGQNIAHHYHSSFGQKRGGQNFFNYPVAGLGFGIQKNGIKTLWIACLFEFFYLFAQILSTAKGIFAVNIDDHR